MKTNASTGQLAKFLALLEEKGVTPELFQERLGNGILADVFDPSAVFPERDEWRKQFGLGPLVPELIILTVDYGLTLEQMIAVGNYDWKNDDLTDKRFPIKGDGVQEFEACLIHPNRSISSEDCIQLIKDTDKTNPWEPAQTEHLLAFGAKYPEEQRKFPIIALGSVGEVDGNRGVPCLDEDGSKRGLHLPWFGGGWRARCRFLAVRKKVSVN